MAEKLKTLNLAGYKRLSEQTVALADGNEYPLILQRSFEQGAELEEKIQRINDLSIDPEEFTGNRAKRRADARAAKNKGEDRKELTIEERVERRRLYAEISCMVVDGPDQMLTELPHEAHMAIFVFYQKVANEAMIDMDPTLIRSERNDT